MFIVFCFISIVGLYLYTIGISESNIITIYILGVLILAIWSTGSMMSIINSIIAVLLFNYFLQSLDFHLMLIIVTINDIFIMFISGVITSSLTKDKGANHYSHS